VARRTELAVLAGGGDFAEQVFECIAHHVLGIGAFAGAGEELVDEVDGVTQHLALVRVELEVGIGHAIADVLQFGVLGTAVGQLAIELTQPGKHDLDQMGNVGLLLTDVTPFAFLMAGEDRWKLSLLALEVDAFKPLEKKQVGDLLHGHQGIGDARGPETVPELVDFFLDVRCEHGWVLLSG
jgi:hypothetical protein